MSKNSPNHFVILCLSFFVSLTTIAECIPSRNNCDYYQCKEQQMRCGPKNYLTFYGRYYCQQYIFHHEHMSQPAVAWLARVRLCLQQVIEEKSTQGASCGQLQRIAFNSHIDCYVETGYCELDLLDRAQILGIASEEISRSGNVLENYQTLKAIRQLCRN